MPNSSFGESWLGFVTVLARRGFAENVRRRHLFQQIQSQLHHSLITSTLLRAQLRCHGFCRSTGFQIAVAISGTAPIASFIFGERLKTRHENPVQPGRRQCDESLRKVIWPAAPESPGWIRRVARATRPIWWATCPTTLSQPFLTG